MAGIYFSPDNVLGKLESPQHHSGDDEGFYSRAECYFYALLQVDSSQTDQTVTLLSTVSGNSATSALYEFVVTIEQGIIKASGYWNGSLRTQGVAENPIPFDELFELVITINPSRNNASERFVLLINGIKQPLTSASTLKSQYIFHSFFKACFGGVPRSIGHSSGLLVLDAMFSNGYNNNPVPVTGSTSTYLTLWRWDFESADNPLLITTSRNGVTKQIAWTNTDPDTVIWTEANKPPSTGSTGGIIIPGNGKTTRIQGVVTENDLPVSRRIYALTQDALEVAGSSERKQAVLASGLSDSDNGTYTLDTSPYEGAVIVRAISFGTNFLYFAKLITNPANNCSR